MKSRTQKAKLNMFFSLLHQGVTLVCGLIVPRLMLKSFGSEAYGATSSIATFLSYVTLLEGGVGAVTRSALYKAFGSDNAKSQIGAVIYETKQLYKKISVAYIAYVFIIALFFKQISHNTVFSYWYTFGLVLVIAIASFVEYLIGISYSLLLQANQETYITLSFRIVSTILNTFAIIVLVNLHCDILKVKLISSLLFAVRPILISIYVKRKYDLLEVKSDKKLLQNKGYAIGQHIAWTLHNNTDITVLTLFKNLSMVSVYSIYNMVISQMHNVVNSFSTGMEAVFGSMLGKGENDKLKLTFGHYETLISLISVTLYTTAAILIIPFVRLYTRGVGDAEYINLPFAIVLIVASLLYCMRTPYGHMVIAAGKFKETHFAAYGEAIINISTSILFTVNYGLVGVAIGTVLATLFRFLYYAIYLSRHILHRNIFLWIKRMVVNFSTFAVLVSFGVYRFQDIHFNNYQTWALYAIAVTAVVSASVLVINIIFYNDDVIEIFQRGFGGISNKVKKRGV